MASFLASKFMFSLHCYLAYFDLLSPFFIVLCNHFLSLSVSSTLHLSIFYLCFPIPQKAFVVVAINDEFMV